MFYTQRGGAGTSHGTLADLSVDDHAQYLLLDGRSGGQVVIGGTGSGDDLTFQTTSNVTKGSYIFSELTTNNGLLTSNSSGVITSTLSTSGLTSVSSATLTDTVLSINAGSITGAVNGTFSGTIQAATLNGTSEIQLNGTSINTGATLSNVAYLDQNNAFAGTMTTKAVFKSLVTKTASYPVGATDHIIIANGASAAVDITLPAPTLGREVIVKAINVSNTVRILQNASETIDGATSITFSAQYESRTLVADGTNWHSIAVNGAILL